MTWHAVHVTKGNPIEAAELVPGSYCPAVIMRPKRRRLRNPRLPIDPVPMLGRYFFAPHEASLEMPRQRGFFAQWVAFGELRATATQETIARLRASEGELQGCELGSAIAEALAGLSRGVRVKSRFIKLAEFRA